jgi:hypothetical protein
VKEVIEEMGVEGLIAKYKGGGEPYLSADDDESAGKWIYPAGVYQPEAGESLKGRCELHVAEQAESPGLSQVQPVSRRGAEDQAVAGQVAQRVIGDAGHGIEENYAYLEGRGVQGYLMYNTFDQEQKRS